jgi:alpha/beta superfamily hydrolase
MTSYARSVRSATRITSGGADLEARWDDPAAEAAAAVVFCHPHPQHGGTMRSPLMHKVTKAMVARGLAVLRFNFRGVGTSSGEWSGGPGEVDDVGAAMAAADDRFGAAVALAGWSFGAAAALRWQAAAASSAAYAGIAPPVAGDLTPLLPARAELQTTRRLFVLGDRDQFVTPAELGAYAASIGGTLEVLSGSDHFFSFREQQVGDLIADFLTAE